jgi:hypothetical protein
MLPPPFLPSVITATVLDFHRYICGVLVRPDHPSAGPNHGDTESRTPVSSRAFGLCLLGYLLDHPPEKVRDWLFDPEPFELGGDLAAVVSRVIDNVA